MRNRITIIVIVIATVFSLCHAVEKPTGKEHTNSIGMELVRVESGTFKMGQIKTPLPWEIVPTFRGRGKFDLLRNGDYDEKPVHKVTITKPIYMGVFEVTNFQYELFDPQHREMRDAPKASKGDDEAVTYVNWYDAQSFCRWLSDLEGLPYRLPTEAEWEYACRAGTVTNFYTGDTLPDEITKPDPNIVLQNPLGLFNMHGGLEEWCFDWYGPYTEKSKTDPVGYVKGDFKVLRGGASSTNQYYRRSANRMGQMPECKNWLMGFRVVIGELPLTKPLKPELPLNQRNVVQRDPESVKRGPDPDKPYFRGPYKYVKIPREAVGPLFSCHNHDPAIVECPNGDLIVCWYTCANEGDRELAQAASRLVWGQVEWQPASGFWDAPDRNDHAPAMWYDEKTNKIYHFTGVAADAGHGTMAMMMRSSDDNGATWSVSRAIMPDFSHGHQLSEPIFRLHDGTIVLVVDGRDTLWLSGDDGLTWTNPGGDIPGIHAGVVQLDDGSLLAMSRRDYDDASMPVSISRDFGKSFTTHLGEFQPVAGGQRLVLLKLREGPLFLASFANIGDGLEITDSSGAKRNVFGLFAALSDDDGKTWKYKRLITDDGPGRQIECTDGGAIRYSAHSSEFRGYLGGCQSSDGLVHLISSRNHFAFNLKWLKTSPPPAPAPPLRVQPLVETFDGPDFDNEDLVDYKGFTGGFNGKGQFTVDTFVHYNGLNRNVGSGSFEALFCVKNIHYNPRGKNISDGMTLGFKDPFNKDASGNDLNPNMFVSIRENAISGRVFKKIPLAKPIDSIKLRLIYKEKTLRWRIYYGIDGAEPTTEVKESKEGIYYKRATTESLSAFFMMSNGRIDIDHFEIKPIAD